MKEKARREPTFVERFQRTKLAPTPSQQFILEICNITGAAENTVRMWICGAQVPSLPSRKLIALHFNTSVEALFPGAN